MATKDFAFWQYHIHVFEKVGDKWETQRTLAQKELTAACTVARIESRGCPEVERMARVELSSNGRHIRTYVNGVEWIDGKPAEVTA